MPITTKTRYGLRALIYISKVCTTDESYVRIKEISQNEKISVQYLEQILYQLKKNKIIHAKRGPNGGYRLSRPAEEVSVYDIFSTLESNIKIVSCGKGVHSCIGKDCTTIYLWKKINKSIVEIMKQTSIKELQEKNNVKEEKC